MLDIDIFVGAYIIWMPGSTSPPPLNEHTVLSRQAESYAQLRRGLFEQT